MTITSIKSSVVVASLMLAQSEVLGPYLTALINYGALGLWVGYLIWRDNRDGKKRDEQHAENIKAQKGMEDAFRTNTNSQMVAMAAMKRIDGAYSELIERIKHDNENPIG